MGFYSSSDGKRMKYNVGDLVLIKDCAYCLRQPRLNFRLGNPIARHLFNSFGIVTKAIKHSDAWEGESTSDSNVYVWFSQLDGKEYYFCEDEVTGEVVK